MTDPTAARSKAEASLRLASLAKSPRARDLFIKLAQEYEARARGELVAEPIEQTETAPTLAPLMADLQQADATPVAELPLVPETPLVPATPRSESDQWLAGLKTMRESSLQD